MKQELLKGLTKEQIAKAEGVELTEEQLAAVSGGCSSTDTRKVCPNCGSKNTELSPK